MTGILTAFIFSLSINGDFSAYRMFFRAKSSDFLSPKVAYTSLMELEKNFNTRKERRFTQVIITASLFKHNRFKSIFDHTIEGFGAEEGESRGGTIESLFTFRDFTTRVYVEGRRYRKDSIFFNPGYGIVTEKSILLNSIVTNLKGEYRRFGKYRKTVMGFVGKNTTDREKGVHFNLGGNVKSEVLPYSFLITDRRFFLNAHGVLDFFYDRKTIEAFLDYTRTSSKQVFAMNFFKLSTGIKWKVRVFTYGKGNIDISGHTKYYIKRFKSSGEESIKDYGVFINASRGKTGALFEINMKRFDYISLVPVDRDERSIAFSFFFKNYELCVDKRDVNYIRAQYTSNSRSMRRFIVSDKGHAFRVLGIDVKYYARLFAGIFVPIYTQKSGYYQRYWENNVSFNYDDSTFTSLCTIRYGQIGEFKNDSVYAPSEDIEYVSRISLHLFKIKGARSFFIQYVDISKNSGIREWKTGMKFETGVYRFEFGIGKLMGRNNSYMEFSGWI